MRVLDLNTVVHTVEKQRPFTKTMERDSLEKVYDFVSPAAVK